MSGGLGLSDGHYRSALDGSFVEKAFGRRGGKQDVDFSATSRLSEYHHVVGITTEVADILLHPFQGHDHIHDARDSRIFVFLSEGGQVKISYDIEAVIEVHKDNVFFRQVRSIVEREFTSRTH